MMPLNAQGSLLFLHVHYKHSWAKNQSIYKKNRGIYYPYEETGVYVEKT